jgi:hypothetical protein
VPPHVLFLRVFHRRFLSLIQALSGTIFHFIHPGEKMVPVHEVEETS